MHDTERHGTNEPSHPRGVQTRDLGISRNIKLLDYMDEVCRASIVLYKMIRSKVEHRLQYKGGALGNR